MLRKKMYFVDIYNKYLVEEKMRNETKTKAKQTKRKTTTLKRDFVANTHSHS